MTLLSALAGDAEIEALLSDRAQVDHMLAVERALAGASADAGWISAEAAGAIAAAIDSFTPDWPDLEAGMAQDGVVVPALSGKSAANSPSRIAPPCTRAPPARTSPIRR